MPTDNSALVNRLHAEADLWTTLSKDYPATKELLVEAIAAITALETRVKQLETLRELAIRTNTALCWAVDDMNGNTSPSWIAFEKKHGAGPGALEEAYSACVSLRDLLAANAHSEAGK